jgi:hypothetical protein
MKIKLLVITLLLISGNIFAQNKELPKKQKPAMLDEKGNFVFGLNAGLSLTGLLYETDRDSDTIKYFASSRPALQLNIDYFASNKISIGFFSSLQAFKVDISHWEYGDSLHPKRTEDKQAKMKRIYIGGKVLYHYKNNSKVDVYSGIRAGLLFWNTKLPLNDNEFVTDFKNEFPMINRPSITIIPIGFRVKFTEQFAANIEFNATAPHLFAFGASYLLDRTK